MRLTKILQNDFEQMCQDNNLNILRNKSILITGASGYIGSWVVRFLLYWGQCKVIAVVRDPSKLCNIVEDNSNLEIIIHDFLERKKFCYEKKVDYIIHTAAITASSEMVEKPVETIRMSIEGTLQLLDYAKVAKVEGFAYFSSMEAYGVVETSDEERNGEAELGKIDLSNIRSCYPESKRMAECLCNCYCEEYGVPIYNIRLAQTFGSGLLMSESRIFMQLVNCAIQGKNFEMKSSGLSYGNYVYITDAVAAVLAILASKKCGETFNVCNEQSTMTIMQMAEMVANQEEGRKFRIVKLTEKNRMYPEDTKLRISSKKLRKLGWEPKVTLEETYKRMIEERKEIGHAVL